MENERIAEEIVTKFLLNTCLPRPQLSNCAVLSAVQCAVLGSCAEEDTEAHNIPQTTGSVAEFYIEPMLGLPHVGDIDVMVHNSTLLAIPQGQSPPTQLPTEFSNYVKVGEIIESHLPGYVYFELRYLLTECNDEGKYNAVEYDRENYRYLSKSHLLNDSLRAGQTGFIHGPALRAVLPSDKLLSIDKVRCIRCLSWPSQAADWPTRHRNDVWPDTATVDRVVNNGCDVLVDVGHRQWEWMDDYQHRLSFSRAEIVLLNSWMPVQQIVYHMLRVFMKAERLTDSADDSVARKLSNYHIKTLMLWACELKPRSWWTDDLSLVRISVELLNNLAVWLTESRCPHYFINNCNLVDSSFNPETISSRLRSISKSCLSSWFVNNYIRKCSQFCPHVSLLFDDVSTTVKLQNAVSVLVDWRLQQHAIDNQAIETFVRAEVAFIAQVSNFPFTALSFHCWLAELTKISTSLSVSLFAVAFLHIARKISRNDFNDELMDILAAIVGESSVPRRYSCQRSSSLSLSRAAKSMKLIAINSRSTVQLIKIELSKAYLYRVLRCKDSDSDSIYCLANVYLAVSHYTTGQYQTAMDHCTLVTRSQDHSQCSSHVVQGELLPKIDDDIDIVLGLAVLYQHVRVRG